MVTLHVCVGCDARQEREQYGPPPGWVYVVTTVETNKPSDPVDQDSVVACSVECLRGYAEKTRRINLMRAAGAGRVGGRAPVGGRSSGTQ